MKWSSQTSQASSRPPDSAPAPPPSSAVKADGLALPGGRVGAGDRPAQGAWAVRPWVEEAFRKEHASRVRRLWAIRMANHGHLPVLIVH